MQFIARENGPERLVTEAEVIFYDGPVAGTKLVGFSLWKGPDGEIYVTFPSRPSARARNGVTSTTSNRLRHLARKPASIRRRIRGRPVMSLTAT